MVVWACSRLAGRSASARLWPTRPAWGDASHRLNRQLLNRKWVRRLSDAGRDAAAQSAVGMSVVGGRAENIYSARVFRLLTHKRHRQTSLLAQSHEWSGPASGV